MHKKQAILPSSAVQKPASYRSRHQYL